MPQDGGAGSCGIGSVAQGLTDSGHQRKSDVIGQVEEFWVSDTSGDCCQIPQHMGRYRFLCEKFDGHKNRWERGYVSLDSRWR